MANAAAAAVAEAQLAVEQSKLLESINEIDSSWNPHMKLDFIKVKIRDYMLEIGREKMSNYIVDKKCSQISLFKYFLTNKARPSGWCLHLHYTY